MTVWCDCHSDWENLHLVLEGRKEGMIFTRLRNGNPQGCRGQAATPERPGL